MECEFIALDKCGEEVEWLRHLFEDIPKWKNQCRLFVFIIIANQL